MQCDIFYYSIPQSYREIAHFNWLRDIFRGQLLSRNWSIMKQLLNSFLHDMKNYQISSYQSPLKTTQDCLHVHKHNMKSQNNKKSWSISLNRNKYKTIAS